MKVKRLEVDDIDIHIGAKIREIRLAKNIAQTALAERLGLTYQQIQKYETGVNRVSVSGLIKIAYLMDVPVVSFLSGLPDRDPEKVWPEVNIELEELKVRINYINPKLVGPIRHLVDMIIDQQRKQ